ncbi:restriction endonuclease subunit S, partial [uncultured Bacteroides sp.]|uniref:restriction endonuclease subunit S n=1 Tax=uncultured Bacteroides sp. TaxID=162156 RepID=UPI000A9B499A
DTQKAIASVLSSLDAKIELNRRINDNLEQQAQALFKSWFVDFEPFKDGKFVESELGMIPEGWRVGRFTECVKISSGGTPKTENSEYWNGAIPFFTPKDTSTTVFTYTTEKYVTDLGVTNCNSPIYPTFTVFITARGTVGKIRMAGQPMAMNQSCYALLPYEKGAEPYIYLLTLNLIGAMQKKANGAVFAAITTKDFDEPVIIFSNSILADFMQLITPIFNQIHKIGIENHNLAELRDTLLPKLMSGELKTNKTTR